MNQAANTTASGEDVILRSEGLIKQFSGLYAMRSVTLNIKHYSIHALIGHNDANKIAYFNLLPTTISCSAGYIRYNDRDITENNPVMESPQVSWANSTPSWRTAHRVKPPETGDRS